MAEKYIDFGAGNDANAGTLAAPWLTFEKFTNDEGAWGLAAGDIAYLRRGVTESLADNVAFGVRGTALAPIQIKDYDSELAGIDTGWAGDEAAVASPTMTVVKNSITVTASADASGDYAAGDGIKFQGEDRIYNIATVVTTTITLEMPYRGDGASGLTSRQYPSLPEVDGGDTLKLVWDKDYWMMEGLTIDNCVSSALQMGSDDFFIVTNIRITGSASRGMVCNGAGIILKQCYLFNNKDHVFTSGSIFFDDVIIDCNNITNADCIVLGSSNQLKFRARNVALKNATRGLDINDGGGPDWWLQNLTFTNITTQIRNYRSPTATFKETALHFDDFNGTKADGRTFLSIDSADLVPSIQTNTAEADRSGGSDTVLKITPGTDWTTIAYPLSFCQLFEWYVYIPAAAKTITINFKRDAAGWTANPTAAEFWIEAEYYGDGSSAFKDIIKSTGTVDFNGSPDWDTLAVTFTPVAAGLVILRGFYGKTKEGGNTNIFYVDTKPEVT